MLIDLEGKAFTESTKTISWDDWLEGRSTLIAKNERVALAFPNDQDANLLKADLAHFAEIILTFPQFKDGRAYSQARTLREVLGYKGHLRACGDLGIDQALFFRRCGFDRFALADTIDLPEWQKALKDFSLAYQPASGGVPIWKLRQKTQG